MAGPRLRIGILGAARNVPFTVMAPLKDNPDLGARIEVVGLASQDLAEAQRFAKEWGIPKAYTFDDMLADSSIDAVYNVLPNQVRGLWTVKALQAKKHVLSETPFCSNALEAVALQRAAEDAGCVLLEGTHPTCHPVTKRVREMIRNGHIGVLERIDLELPIGHSLQGKAVCSKMGALMGLGCHGIAIARALAGEEPKVVRAKAERTKESPEVDFSMICDLAFPSGVTSRIDASMSPAHAKKPTTFKVLGSSGCINVKEWFTSGLSTNVIDIDHFDDHGTRKVETVDNPYPEKRTTFYFQLMAFADEVQLQEARKSVGMPWDYTSTEGPSDAVRNMAIIDAAYRAADMAPKQPLSPLPPPYDRIGLSKL